MHGTIASISYLVAEDGSRGSHFREAPFSGSDITVDYAGLKIGIIVMQKHRA